MNGIHADAHRGWRLRRLEADVRPGHTRRPARRDATSHRILRNIENPTEVTILTEFASVEDAQAGRERLLASGVLERFADKDLPKVVEEAETHRY